MPPSAPHDSTAAMLPTPHPQVVARTLPDGAVLFHPATETYFGLNATGTLVWEAMVDGARDVDAVVARLAAAHPEVAPDVLRGDVVALLAELDAAGLVQA